MSVRVPGVSTVDPRASTLMSWMGDWIIEKLKRIEEKLEDRERKEIMRSVRTQRYTPGGRYADPSPFLPNGRKSV
ncbi:hypothetical protein Hypma_014464 [Hypsizygus marmoreus]|uniref:Uncharacterized protein n=1 Tax=Hypsizygus marmoreus TaxID=39966 RepID=A0A369JH90_HYPMA|nr:hypothetical protein Hypma_014464 [Hypsizygus marmoreus]